MKSEYIPSVTLHQQERGISPKDFAALHGITQRMLSHYIKTGRVIGARQDARSKRWTIYPPAKLVDVEGDSMRQRKQRRREAEAKPLAHYGKPPAGAGVACARQPGFPTAAAALSSDATEAQEAPAAGWIPEGGSSLALPVQDSEPGCFPAEPVLDVAAGRNVYKSPENRRVCHLLHQFAVQQFRAGLHYLRLDSNEVAQLYAALSNERSRLRKKIGKGLESVGVLRASDSVWQKLQAVSRQGRLL